MAGLPLKSMIRDKNYRVFWSGQTISWLGGWTQSVAQGWLVWSLTRSPAQLALTAVMVSLPALLFSLFGGVTADRLEKRTLLTVTQSVSIIPSLALGLLTACGGITPSRVLSLAFLQGIINAFDVPARQAFLSELVPRERLQEAIALNAVSFNATRMLGPVIAGLTIASFGTAPCFFLNALSFLVGAGALRAVRTVAEPPEPERGRGWVLPLGELREGCLFVLKEREIRRPLLMVAVVSLFGIPFVPLLPVFADALQVGARGLGVMSACAGGGSLLAALALTGGTAERPGGAPPAGILFAAALCVFARSGHFALSLLALALAGGALVAFLALVNASIQKGCPDPLRGRVMGAYTFALLGMAPVGSTVMGYLAATLGADRALALSASLCLCLLIFLSLPLADLLPQVRRPGGERRGGGGQGESGLLADEAL